MTRRGWLPLLTLLLVLGAPAPALAASADISVGVTDTPDPAREAGQVTYETTVTNNGAGDVAVRLDVPIPSGTTFVNASVSQGTVMFDGSTVTANFGTVNHGESASLTLTVSVEHPGTVTLTATASLPTPGDNDPNPANNSTSEKTTVTGLTVAPSPAFGDQVLGTLSPARTFTLTNRSAEEVGLAQLETSGDTFDFLRFGDSCASGPTLAVDETCVFTVRFAPGALGNRAATRTFEPDPSYVNPDTLSPSTIDPVTIALTGTGIAFPTSQGPQGPPGEQGPAAFKLVVAAAQGKLSSLAGRRVSFAYASTLDADVTLNVLKGARKVASVKGRAHEGGNTIRWNGKSGRKAAKPGRYVLRLTARNGTQTAGTSSRLRIKPRRR
jgi:uncharacterized repeat protein (TIGR01451 family)